MVIINERDSCGHPPRQVVGAAPARRSAAHQVKAGLPSTSDQGVRFGAMKEMWCAWQESNLQRRA